MDGSGSISDRGPWTKTQVLNLISAVLQQQGITPLQAAALAAKLPYPSTQQWYARTNEIFGGEKAAGGPFI